jgi:GPH family glycoside/pentoside/hexuronide:cation symporter
MTHSSASNSSTPADEHREYLSLATKLAYGAGDLSPAMATLIVSFFQLFFLVIVAGINPGSAGLILTLARVWDAVTDPLMGLITDKTRSRFGRRRPWLLIGALPFGLIFFLMWIVPPFDETGRFFYYLAMVLLFGTVTTIVSVPYTALTPELTRDYDERTNLTSFRFTFSIGGSLLGLILHQSIVQMFADQQTGYMVASAVIGVLCVPPFVWCFLGVHERDADAEQATPRVSFMDQLRAVVHNKPYLFVVGIFLCSWLVVQITAAVLPFYITFWLERNDLQLPIIASVQGTALLFLFFWNRVSTYIGKKATYLSGMVFWLGVQAFLFFLQPGQEILAFVVASLAGVGVAAAYLIPWSMVADVIEFDELSSGQRREGIFYGFMVFVQKLGVGAGLFVVGNLLEARGFQSPGPGQDPTTMAQPEAAIFAIRLAISPVPALLLLVSMVLVWFYPLTQQKHAELRAQLAARAEAEAKGE